MRKIKKIDPKTAQSVESFASCTCNCGLCNGCNVASMGPFQYETGDTAMYTIYGSGYMK